MSSKTYRNGEQDRRLTVVEDHQIKYNAEMGAVKIDIASIKSDISWIKKFIFTLIPIMAGMIVSLIYIVLKLK